MRACSLPIDRELIAFALALTGLAVVGCTLFALAGCRLLANNDEAGKLALTGVLWKLDAIENAGGHLVFQPSPSRTYKVTFENDGRLTARNACNACIGQYVKAGSRLSIGISCTEAACGTPAPYLGYGDALASATDFAIRGRRLHIDFVDRGGDAQTLVHIAAEE